MGKFLRESFAWRTTSTNWFGNDAPAMGAAKLDSVVPVSDTPEATEPVVRGRVPAVSPYGAAGGGATTPLFAAEVPELPPTDAGEDVFGAASAGLPGDFNNAAPLPPAEGPLVASGDACG